MQMGIITASTSYQYVKEACGDRYPVLKLGMAWPLPERKIRDFAASVEQLVVVEELDGFIEEHCRNLGLNPVGKERFSCIDELSQNLVAEQLGIAPDRGHEAGGGYSRPAAGHVRGMSPSRTFLYPGQKQADGVGGHRLLYPGGRAAPGRH